MLVELQKLKIENNGYNRSVSFNRIYVNVDHVVSIADCTSINDFLLSEGHVDKKYSLLNLSVGNKIEEIIVVGTSEEVYGRLNKFSKTRLLHD